MLNLSTFPEWPFLKHQCYIGIDPGKKGAITMFSHDGTITSVLLPGTIKNRGSRQWDLDKVALSRLINNYWFQKPYVCIEQQSTRPNQSCSATFKTGRMQGMLEGLVHETSYPFGLVRPQAWTKKFAVGSDKKVHIAKAKEFFPALDMRRGTDPESRCRSDQDGLADSILICLYGMITQEGIEYNA